MKINYNLKGNGGVSLICQSDPALLKVVCELNKTEELQLTLDLRETVCQMS